MRKKTYLLSVRFADMGPEDAVFLTDAGQPVVVEEHRLDQYARFLEQGLGFLGDLEVSRGGNWCVEQVFAQELGPRLRRTVQDEKTPA